MYRLIYLFVFLASISCSVDDTNDLTSADLETEIIDMNWCSMITDLYLPEEFDDSVFDGTRADNTHSLKFRSMSEVK